MAGLVPAIHVLLPGRLKKTWMPATRAGITIRKPMITRKVREHLGLKPGGTLRYRMTSEASPQTDEPCCRLVVGCDEEYSFAAPACLLLLPACGEKVGMRGRLRCLSIAEIICNA